MGADPAILTGAMLSGIFFGDALSPSSQVIHTTIASQHDPVTNKGADLLRVMKQRLPYLLIAGILSAVLFYALGTSGSAQNPELLASMCNPKGLWMLLPILLLLIICFKTSDLFVGVTYAIVAGIIVGIATGLFRFSDLISIQYETQELHGILFDGLSGVVDIIISTILLYGLIAIAVEGGMMEKCCNYLTSRKALQHVGGAEAMISLGVGIVNILLAGCVLPSILMFKDIADTIGKKGRNITGTQEYSVNCDDNEYNSNHTNQQRLCHGSCYCDQSAGRKSCLSAGCHTVSNFPVLLLLSASDTDLRYLGRARCRERGRT